MNQRARAVRTVLVGAAPLVAIAAALVVHSLQFHFVTDDAYVSFVYARNLAEHGQLAFNPGLPPVEGYTNFSWTVLLGLLALVGLPPEATSLVLGTAFGIGGLYLAARLCREIEGTASAWDYLAPALLALSSGWACWSSGGLETQMFTFLVALALVAYVRAETEPRAFRLLGVALALAALTRPEGLLVAAVLGLHRLALDLARDRRLPGREELVGAAIFLVVSAAHLTWRWWYYGHPLPNTYYVKAAGEASAAYHQELRAVGLYYVWQWATQSMILWGAPLAVVGFALARPGSRRFALGTAALAVTAVYLVYAVRVGGDFMGLHRFVMPLFFVGAVGVALGLRVVCRLVPAGVGRRAVSVGLAAALVAGFAVTQVRLTREQTRDGNWQSDRGIDTPAYLKVYALDRARIGRHMRECFRDDDFSIFGGVGAKPYHARARGIDVFGLVSDRIAHEVPRTRPRPGHNKWGPDRLLLEHEPDLVFHCYSLHRDPDRPQFNCNPRAWTARGFEQVTLHIPGLRERGEYYTFFVREDREFQCPGTVHRSGR